MKLAILDDYQRAAPALDCFAKLAAHDVTVFSDPVTDETKLAGRLEPFDAVVLIRERTRVTASLVAKLPRLKLLVQTAKIGPHVDVQACHERGITVCDGTGGPVSTAELTWALILASARNLVAENERLKDGLWQGSVGLSLAGKRLGLLGYGRIAQRVARYAAAFEMEVAVWGRESTLVRAREAGLRTIESLPEIFAQSDVVSVHLRLNPETRGIVRLEHLAAMKPEAIFANTSRAELVESGALERALVMGRLGRAALDVFEDEPWIGAAPGITALPGVTATPHLGFVERGNYERYFGDAFDAVNAYASGSPVRVVEIPGRQG
jgi:D-3-phosphoglycerate dehydrogenase